MKWPDLNLKLGLLSARFCIALLISVAMAAEMSSPLQSTVDQHDLDQFFRDYGELKNTHWENWILTEAEWNRYQDILEKTPFGVWQHTATPYQILATYARTLEEKRRYARLEAMLDQWREDKALTFQQIYNDEREVIFARYSALVRNLSPTIANTGSGDSVAFFTYPGGCNPRCVAVMQRLLATGAHIDIYVIGAKTEQEIFAWAEAAKVPVERVRVRQITLNFEKGEFKELSALPEMLVEMPVAYIRRARGYERLAL
jgi:integrating conjugative element protein (TIGR03759 family)